MSPKDVSDWAGALISVGVAGIVLTGCLLFMTVLAATIREMWRSKL